MATVVWYRVRDLDAARTFYKDVLGFKETFVDFDDRWAQLEREQTSIALAEGEPEEEGGVAALDVEDVKAEAERLRGEGIDVGVVFELHGQIRLVDIFDPDGNRIQLSQPL